MMTLLNTCLPVFCISSCTLLLAARSASGAEPGEPPAEQSTLQSSNQFDVQLAKVRLQLAKVELERALGANERVRIYPPVTLQFLRRNVDVAQAKLEAVTKPGGDSHDAHLRELENNLKTAELKWKIAFETRERSPGALDEAGVEALRLRVEVARLALARARQPETVTTPLNHLQWEIEQLRDEMLELTLRVEELSRRGSN